MSDKGYPLAAVDTVRIVLKIRREGEIFKLAHCFREPTAADRKEYYRRRAQAEVRNKAPADFMDENEWLWGHCIKSVEGYDFQGQESGVRSQEPGAKGRKTKSEKRKWIDMIPLEHKLWAVEGLLSRIGLLQGIESKN